MLNKIWRISLCVNIYVIIVHGLRRKALIDDGTENRFRILSERV
jgi:hypothetical protein